MDINRSEKDILKQAPTDQENLAPLFRRYQVPLYHFVYRFVKDRETIEDIVQETFLRCIGHSDNYHRIRQFSTWL